jgi:hypothetical protein
MKEFKLFGITFRKITSNLYCSNAGFEIFYESIYKQIRLYSMLNCQNYYVIKTPFKNSVKSLSKNINQDIISLLENQESLSFLLKHKDEMKVFLLHEEVLKELSVLDRYEILL